MSKNPQQKEALLAKRERQKIEGAIAMKEYLLSEEATRRKTKRLRELRLAREASSSEASSSRQNAD